MNAKYAYYPGCSLHSSAKEYDMSVKTVCGKLGVGLDELKGWVCCGATPVHAVNPKLAIALSTKNLAIAAGMGSDVAVACSACFGRMKTAAHHVNHDPAERDEMNRLADVNYNGTTEVYHIVTVLQQQGADAIASKITKKLEGLNIACYYGCLMLRPPKVAQVDDPENPSIMEDLIAPTGARTVKWNFRNECCGASFSVARTDMVLKMCNDIISDAKSHGADAIAVACPLCHINLDMRQPEVEKKYGVSLKMPVMYFTQVIGLAMGATPAELGLKKLVVSPMNMLKQKNLL